MTKAEKTRQLIIEKAAVVMNHKGMAGTSISDIMEATKLAKGGIYGNFESKDEICIEVFDFLSKKQSTGIDAYISKKSSPKEKLHALLDFHCDSQLHRNTGGCPMLNFGTEADDTNPAIKQRVGEAIKRSQDRINALISEGIAKGDFKASVNPNEFAIKVFTMLEGAILTSRIFGNNDQLKVVTNIIKSEIESFSK